MTRDETKAALVALCGLVCDGVTMGQFTEVLELRRAQLAHDLRELVAEGRLRRGWDESERRSYWYDPKVVEWAEELNGRLTCWYVGLTMPQWFPQHVGKPRPGENLDQVIRATRIMRRLVDETEDGRVIHCHVDEAALWRAWGERI